MQLKTEHRKSTPPEGFEPLIPEFWRPLASPCVATGSETGLGFEGLAGGQLRLGRGSHDTGCGPVPGMGDSAGGMELFNPPVLLSN